MTTQRLLANGIDIAYETFGAPGSPPLLLVMGLGTQLLGWPTEFCQDLADSGFFVIRFDNRDIGLSTHLSELDAPDPFAVALRRRRPAYLIADMATDTVALIEALGLGPVHLVGASMGGFIAQTVAIERPDLVTTLTLFMTSTGSRRVGGTTLRVLARIVRGTPGTTRDTAIASSLDIYRLIGSPAYRPTDAEARAMAADSYDRAYDPLGSQRQLGAVIAQPDRTAALRRLRRPTLVIHGLHDPLVRVSGGLAIARAVPGSLFVGIHGMGHDLPRELWPHFIREIAAVTAVRPNSRR